MGSGPPLLYTLVERLHGQTTPGKRDEPDKEKNPTTASDWQKVKTWNKYSTETGVGTIKGGLLETL